MIDNQKPLDIETLARMACRLAGQDPDKHLNLTLANVLAFKGLSWRYPDFLQRADAAYDVLQNGHLSAA